MVSFMIRLMELQWDLLWVQFLQTFLCAMEKSLSLVVPGLNCVEVIQLFREGEGAPKAPPPVLIDSNGGIEVALLYVKA